MRDNLPKKAKRNECGIVNLNASHQNGSHWVAYIIYQNKENGCQDLFKYSNTQNRPGTLYFDSYGNLCPPIELIAYFGNFLTYNRDSFQSYNTVICGHLCLKFLYKYCNEIFG